MLGATASSKVFDLQYRDSITGLTCPNAKHKLLVVDEAQDIASMLSHSIEDACSELELWPQMLTLDSTTVIPQHNSYSMSADSRPM